MDLREAFAAEGVVAVVGAGGKKSTLYALAADLGRAVLTATVRIPPFEGHVERLLVTDEPEIGPCLSRSACTFEKG